jgi:hypothetical protein
VTPALAAIAVAELTPLDPQDAEWLSQSWDWRAALPSLEWHGISLKGWPGWDRTLVYRRGAIMPADYPPTVLITTSKRRASSRTLAILFDDMARGAFYYRDWTASGLPFVNDDEIYHSRFWFQRESDRAAFERMVRVAGLAAPTPEGE